MLENPKATWLRNLKEAQETLEQFLASPDQIERCTRFSALVAETLKSGGKIMTCGNGGSHCDALHFAEEHTGRYRKDRRPLAAMALGDAPHVTCVGNDYGFDHIFSRQVEALGKPGDLLITFSTSGKSPNAVKALEAAKARGLKSVALLGRDGGPMKGLADLAIVIPAQTSDRIQEMHIKLVHIVIESAERELFPELY